MVVVVAADKRFESVRVSNGWHSFKKFMGCCLIRLNMVMCLIDISCISPR